MDTLQQARDAGSLSPPVLAVLGRLCCLFGLGLVEAGSGDLLEAGWMTGRMQDALWLQLAWGRLSATSAQHRAVLVSSCPQQQA